MCRVSCQGMSIDLLILGSITLSVKVIDPSIIFFCQTSYVSCFLFIVRMPNVVFLSNSICQIAFFLPNYVPLLFSISQSLIFCQWFFSNTLIFCYKSNLYFLSSFVHEFFCQTLDINCCTPSIFVWQFFGFGPVCMFLYFAMKYQMFIFGPTLHLNSFCVKARTWMDFFFE